RLEKEAQAEQERFIEVIDRSVKEMIKDEVKMNRIELPPEHIDLYDCLAKSYKLDKDLFETYGSTYSLKRDQKDKDKDEDPSDGSDRGSKRRKTAEEPGQDSGVLHDQELDMGNNDDQPAVKAVSKDDWFKKPEKPPTPDREWNKRQSIDFRPPQTWISNIAKEKEPPRTFDELMSTPIDFSAFVMNRLKIENL
ncbi:hypothetical protein Tco_0061974, partial [Tanacetum coccineum]